MLVVFLDIVGDLTNEAAKHEPVVLFEWLPFLAKLLVSRAEVRIVVYGTWRYDHTDEELRNPLGPLADKFIGTIPRGLRRDQRAGGSR